MEKDGRYRNIKLLFKKDQIHRFSEIFSPQLLPKTVLAKDLKKNNNTINRLIRSPGGFKIKDVIILSDLFELPLIHLAKLFVPDLPGHYEVEYDENDDPYKYIRAYFDEGRIKKFEDIFKEVKVATIARDIGKGRGRFGPIEKFTVEQIDRLGKLSKITLAEMFQLVDAQLKKKKKIHP